MSSLNLRKCLGVCLLFLGTTLAAPAPEAQKVPLTLVTDIGPVTLVKPLPVLTVTATVTSTVSVCPGGKCRTICATPTVTAEPTGYCSFDTLSCPMAKCMYVPPITSTYTTYCKTYGCEDLPTDNCDALPTMTVIPPCPTKCPVVCPVLTTDVAVACTTTTTPIIKPPIYTIGPVPIDPVALEI